MEVNFLTPARAEFQEAVAFYNSQKDGLGSEFAEEIKKAIARIMQYPEVWSLISKRTCRCRVNRFPFGVIYQLREDTLLILAVMRLNREPDSWKGRLAKPLG